MGQELAEIRTAHALLQPGRLLRPRLLGKPLALEFARTQLPACYEQVCAIFSRRGAYARFKALLERHQSLDAWHQWEAEQTRQALREWCTNNGLTPAD